MPLIPKTYPCRPCKFCKFDGKVYYCELTCRPTAEYDKSVECVNMKKKI